MGDYIKVILKRMAESTTRNQDFKAKKEIFDKIASKVCCSFCKIVPRGAPIYQAKGPKGEGQVLCADCMPNANKSSGIFQSSILEDLLQFLPISCKYQKNKCPVVKDQMDILEHEKDCQFRDVLCSMQHCLSRIPVYQYKNHVVKEHHIQTNTSSEIQSKNGV